MPTTIDRVRQFNRDWTKVLGLLDRGLLATDHSLPEARVLFELGRRPRQGRSELRARLDLDASYLTRILGRLADDGLLTIEPSPTDGRAVDVVATAEGRKRADDLDRRSSSQIEDLLAPLSPAERRQLVDAMTVVRRLVRRGPGDADHRDRARIRHVEPGDLGWVVERNIYADEFGWNQDYEALVARIVADFHDELRPDGEGAWIAEVDGARAGSVFCRRRAEGIAQLRLLVVEPWARGSGVGSSLVDHCVDFARTGGYERMMLWTNDVLVAARSLYERAGFELVEEEPHHSFGVDLVGQIWERDL